MRYRALFLLLIFATFMGPVSAKRAAPAPVPPLVYENVQYTTSTTKPGYIWAYINNTNEIFWEKQVYQIQYNQALEKDVQDDFISSLEIQNGNLLVTSEKGKKYLLDPKTGNVVSGQSKNIVYWSAAAIGLIAIISLIFRKIF